MNVCNDKEKAGQGEIKCAEKVAPGSAMEPKPRPWGVIVFKGKLDGATE